MKIHRLPEEVAKRIAAGEVVERPFSVVKELLENALDAGAKRIDLQIKGAGRLLIRITDDGCGMDQEDLKIAIHRHTTSKIGTVEDIEAITSLGFRGEALYSIAAVSKLDIVSSTRDAGMGHRLRSEGGQILHLEEAGASVGTTVEVRDLFWNTPARLKFLKSASTEVNHIFETVAHHALARPEIGFRLEADGKILMDLNHTHDLLSRIKELYEGLGEDWIKVAFEDPSIQIRGFLAHPKMSRANRSHQFFFVNRRPVKALALGYGLEAAFHSLVPEGRHPVGFIFLELDPGAVDINIHPAKREIRFHRSSWVQDSLREAVRRALSEGFASGSPNSTVWPEKVRDAVSDFLQRPSVSSRPSYGSKPIFQNHEKIFSSSLDPQKEGVHASTFQIQTFPDDLERSHAFRVLGCLDSLYWVIQWPDRFSLVDQHAAHERVLYERYLKDWKNHKLEVQPLLIPATFELSKEDHSVMLEYQETLRELGFGLEEFGENSILVNQVPAYCQTHELKGLILDLLDDLKTFRKTPAYGEHRLEERIILRACKSAVKAHDSMSSQEIERLIEDLLSLELPYTCPHGRPTLIQLTADDLAKMFKRK
ncbi:MAG: DNA mismatch repair endonuclease MutL [Chlamydiae bacterium]|nr:DNA mismatch repair endonuclease MutL [Chlamydiota bacterium]MBI3276620.1 DNA mismatch repair endonuclease MutL [Chlamydiota bacterium]